MKPGARIAAAIEILADIETRHRPGADAVKDWMLSHRFAGSKDRAAIGDAVFGALRWRASSAWRMANDNPRAWVLGALCWGFGESPEAIELSCHNDPHAPAPLSEAERAALAGATLEGAPPHVRGDYPDWLDASFARAFGEARAEEGAALAAPAPLDLRANTLKTTREKLLAALEQSPLLREPAALTPCAPHGVRVPWSRGRSFAWNAEQSFQKGWFEVQDEGSQLAALMSGAKAGMQVLDVCAGGGGKTLALAAQMHNKGQIYAFDVDARRLAPLKARLDRAGARNVQIRAPLREGDALADLHARMDVVLADAPCSGSGTWRRNPESKWRLRPAALEKRQEEQQSALGLAAPLLKPGALLIYVTCSVLPEENDDAIARFIATDPRFAPCAAADLIANAAEAGVSADLPHRATRFGLQMTPLLTGCDGFFVAALRRAG